jgi:uncharacterized protein
MKIVIICFCACAISQLIKVAILLAHKRRLRLRDFLTTGGMPSAHSAIVSALAAAVALYEGLDSVAFGITAVFAFIVICDAAGLRRSVGRQADILDRIIRELQDRNAIAEGNRDSSEIVGHTLIQVIAGAILGAAVACLCFLLLE